MSYLKRSGLLCALAALLAGCTTLSAQNLLEDYKREEKSTSQADPQGINGFAFDLLHILDQKQDENTLFSPLSIAIALAMTENGARENTLRQMEEVMGLPLESMNETMLWLQNQAQEETETLQMANSIWYNDLDSLSIEPAFLQTVKNYYDAQIYKESFDQTLAGEINAWVKEETKGMIEELVDEIPEDAIMYLVNAMAFESHWLDDYEEYQVTGDLFFNADGTQSEVEFMHNEEYWYLEDENFTGFLKPYEDENYAFAALLPKEEKPDLSVNSLDVQSWKKLMDTSSRESVITTLPKFELTQELSLKDVLESMGMTDAFEQDLADFAAMGTSTEGNIYINRVLHKAFLSVFEQGTKAGAATAVEMTTESAAEISEPKKVELNRPFIFALVDVRSNTPVFLGTIRNLS